MNWISQLQRGEKVTLGACFAGYAMDSFDFMIYTFMIPTLVVIWHMSKSEAGLIATGALLSSAVGGWFAGVLSDKYGRVRMLQVTIGWYCLFTFLSGLTHSPGQLFVTRALQGFGMGGEWSVGSVLIAEMIRPEHRGKAVGLVVFEAGGFEGKDQAPRHDHHGQTTTHHHRHGERLALHPAQIAP